MDLPILPPRRTGLLARPGSTLYWEVTGSGPAIVFAHGLGGNHMSWWQQVAHFSREWTCVTFAHRGFAPSTAIEGGPDPADYTDDLAALIAHLDLADVRVVGQSMGGWSAVEYALRRPPGLRAIVLAATTGSIDVRQIRERERSQLAEWAAFGEDLMPKLWAAGMHPACGARMAEEQPAMHLLYRQVDSLNGHWDKEALRKRLMDSRTRPPEDLRKVACPILFIPNDEDVVIPPFAPDAIAAVVPGVKVAHIEDAGHSGYWERPAVFNRILGEFLANTR